MQRPEKRKRLQRKKANQVQESLVSADKDRIPPYQAKKKDPLEALPDGGSGSVGGGESSSSLSAKKNAAALRALQKCLKDSPKVFY